MDIGDANHFWIEAGAMSGPPAHRHQVEFANEVAEFFDDSARDNETVPLCLPGNAILWRPLTYRGTDYGQWTDIWRLGLLTPNMGGPQYAGRVLHFTRVLQQSSGGWQMYYELRVDDEGSAQEQSWRSATPPTQIATTGGPEGREYGWY
jgi:hypothetical protein